MHSPMRSYIAWVFYALFCLFLRLYHFSMMGFQSIIFSPLSVMASIVSDYNSQRFFFFDSLSSSKSIRQSCHKIGLDDYIIRLGLVTTLSNDQSIPILGRLNNDLTCACILTHAFLDECEGWACGELLHPEFGPYVAL